MMIVRLVFASADLRHEALPVVRVWCSWDLS